MKKLKKGLPPFLVQIIIIIAISLCVSFCGAVLTGYESSSQDITDDQRFGCTWSGGQSSRVSCACREANLEMVVEEGKSFPSFTTDGIEIMGCSRVRFGKNAILGLRSLRTVHLHDITALQFDDFSMNWYGFKDVDEERYEIGVPSLKVSIENCNITRISSHTFRGRISEITLNGVTVQNLESYAFSSLIHNEHIKIHNTILQTIRLDSFKKFETGNLELYNVRAKLVPSRTFSNITVFDRFTIKNCQFDTIYPSGFIIYNPQYVEIANTKVRELDGEAFVITAKGDVLFKNNTFETVNDGAFRGINRNPEDPKYFITFDSNEFGELTRDSLSVGDLTAKFSGLYLRRGCDCTDLERNVKNSEYHSEINCLLDGKEYVSVEEFKSGRCSVIMGYSNTIIIVGVVLVLLVIVSTVLVVYFKRVYRSKKYGNEKMSKQGNMSLIVPDGRTYRETELHVIVERADLLTTDL